jgi:PDZ domain-containing protein
MNRRSLASISVFSLLAALVAVAAFLPVPYVTESPGPTINVLGKSKDQPIISVTGHRTFPTDGDLRLTTVSVTNPTHRIGLGEALAAWFDGARAVYPRDVIYPPEQSADQVEKQSAVEMVSSQDSAKVAALRALGYDLPTTVKVVAVSKGAPAQGRLRAGDLITSVDGTPTKNAQAVTRGVQAAGAGTPVTLEVRRGGATKTVTVTPEASPDDPPKALLGIQIQPSYDFPFDVKVRLGDDIGGPSAGLIFSLGVYDTLTPGSLTGGANIAGTGTISADGRVGPIGGIQQKIVAAADAGAKIFLVPPANCDSALHADVTKDDILLVKAATLKSAVASLKAYAQDPSADLPSCR